MSSLESLGWLGFWLDSDEQAVALDDVMDSLPVAWQVVLVLESSSSPRWMLLFEL